MNEEQIQKEVEDIKNIFSELRESLREFCEDRSFVMTNPQIFTFLSYCPNALAIAGDGVVDETEIAELEKLSKLIDVNKMVNLEMAELMALASEPSEAMINEEFNLRVGAELLYLSRNMPKYETNLIKALKSLLKFDHNPDAEKSLTKSFAVMMENIVKNNKSKNKEHELNKIKEIQKELGM